MKGFLILSLCMTGLLAQSIAVVSPTANQSVSGFIGFSLSANLANAPTATRVCWTIDAYRAVGTSLYAGGMTNSTYAALSSIGCSLTSPYSLPWNTFSVMNGPHQAVATAYDAAGNVVATSSAVSFSVDNTWPVSCAPAMTVTTGTALGSNWSGSVNVTPTVTSCTGDSMSYRWFVDGVPQYNGSTSSNSFTFPIDTTKFTNGSHIVGVQLWDNTHHVTYPDSHNNGRALEWTRTVTFANGSAPMELRLNAREVFLAPTNTFTLTCTIVNADGSTSSPTCEFYSQNTSVCTVDAVTGLVTAVAKGNCQVRVMADQITGTDLHVNDCSGTCLESASHPLTQSDVGRAIHVTSGTGFTPGFYELTALSGH